MDMLSVIMHNLIKAECHNYSRDIKCHYAEWDYTKCHYVDCHGANSICVV
jgi:hypothetical protein